MWWHDHCVRRDRERGFPFNPASKKYWQRVKSELASFTVAEREDLVGRMQADGRAARSKRKAHDALSLAALPRLELCDGDDQGGAAVVLHEDTTWGDIIHQHQPPHFQLSKHGEPIPMLKRRAADFLHAAARSKEALTTWTA